MICDPLLRTHFLPAAILLDDLEIGFLLPARGQYKNAQARSLCYEKATQVQSHFGSDSAVIGLTVIFS